MKYLVIALALLAACDDDQKDTPEVAARKTECKKLLGHIFRISPQSAPQFAGKPEADAQALADRLVANLPVEDIEQCAAGEPEVIACMLTAADVPAVRACIPPPYVFECLGNAKQDAAKRKACFTMPPPKET